MFRRLVSHGCRNLTEHISSISRQPIERGGFGIIYRGRLGDGTLVAIKLLSQRGRVSSRSKCKLAKRASLESYSWSKCNHPSIHELLGVARYRGHIAMISPWMEFGSLPKYISRHPDVDRLQLAHQTAIGLAYLHLSGTVHGDLKGSNVLVSANGVAKLTDFGSTKLREHTLRFTTTTSCDSFSVRYTAPEVIEGGPQTMQSDVYALGMTILEIVTGEIPYSNVKVEAAVLYKILRGELPPRPNNQHLSSNSAGDKLWSLIAVCWSTKPSDRPDSAAIRDQLEIMAIEARRT
ncbi:Tyrosine kinase catalytic domain protein [Ceratobasidium sp. AG-Ba]|nr:Tyrosine kinase catalytic domain protein [Ceratobasidium sp. AG-Ba]QRW13908.1 Tyrosine kinase catalytic domain protein [Ceratobasidium sp. AG-Ba]